MSLSAPTSRVTLNRLRANDFRLTSARTCRCHEHSSGNDRAALSDLVHRYAANVDDRQFDSVAELFTAEAELTVPEPPAALQPIHRTPGSGGHRRRGRCGCRSGERTEHAIVGEVYSELSEEVPEPGTARGRIACIAHHCSQRADEVHRCGLASALRRRVRVDRRRLADQSPGVDDQRHRDPAGAPRAAARPGLGVPSPSPTVCSHCIELVCSEAISGSSSRGSLDQTA